MAMKFCEDVNTILTDLKCQTLLSTAANITPYLLRNYLSKQPHFNLYPSRNYNLTEFPYEGSNFKVEPDSESKLKKSQFCFAQITKQVECGTFK